jgi:hypothetical protein
MKLPATVRLRTYLFSGISMLALASVEGYHGYLLFVWMYGLFLGGFEVTLRVYCYERLRIRQFSRGWGFIQGAKALPCLVGLPITAYISESTKDPKAGFYFSFTCCILGGTVLFLMECFKGGYGHDSSFYGGSRMDLCKTDTNMTFEMNGSASQGGVALGESASDSGQRPTPVMLPPLAAPNGHLKCTCLPSTASNDFSEAAAGEKMDQDVLELSIALAEVSSASNNDEAIEVVREAADVGGGEDDIIDIAQALYAAGVKPELLACISEETLNGVAAGQVMSDEEQASGHNGEFEEDEETDDEDNPRLHFMWSEYEQDQQPPLQALEIPPRLVASQSEPDLVHLLKDEKPGLPHPSSRSIEAVVNPSQLVRRQKTWHHFKLPTMKKASKASSSSEANVPMNGVMASEVTSFV